MNGRELAELVAKAAHVETKRGLTSHEAREKYGFLAEAYSLNQQIDSTLARRELVWEPIIELSLETITNKKLAVVK